MALIITGFQRSGKSLLRKLCNLHPDIALTEGMKNFRELNDSYAHHERALRKVWQKHPLVRFDGRGGSLWRVHNAVFVARYLMGLRTRRSRRIGLADVEEVLLRLFPEASVVGDTNSTYVFALDKLTRVPGLRVAIIHRDCRDVTSSLLGIVARKRHDAALAARYATVERIATKWVLAIEAMEGHADQAHCIRYRDLVADPQSVLAAFGNWLGVDPRGFQFQMLRSRWVGEYKQYLSDDKVARVMSVAGPAMERLGYL